MITFNKKYFGLAVLIFLVEIAIALFVHDNFIRPYIGDLLVVVLIYCFIKSFLKLPVLTVALFVLIFSFSIEILQFLNIVEKLGLENSKTAKIVIGTSFNWLDLLAYLTGIGFVLITEKYWVAKKLKARPD
ncbi:MAG: DUF2809 domain-containing protein [Bacteroidetes bacterium]|jgi:hypothetical protein|nr:DUF2809 domain-containing protein [Bacteroidota bacterium]MBT5530813.1 DUF2809 domain-containing protein [Cytophagia bacterium]MBT3423696.1 DUF2809 domain-containing protein [Bacteroidota bacterium]MBT3934011.1 DUF2809 domain-containing protein [Bacteroidota bacterium]MBT4338783.1 DUF2809 domain-containing protein [Bacteroidota bacterium]